MKTKKELEALLEGKYRYLLKHDIMFALEISALATEISSQEVIEDLDILRKMDSRIQNNINVDIFSIMTTKKAMPVAAFANDLEMLKRLVSDELFDDITDTNEMILVCNCITQYFPDRKDEIFEAIKNALIFAITKELLATSKIANKKKFRKECNKLSRIRFLSGIQNQEIISRATYYNRDDFYDIVFVLNNCR